MAERTLTFAQRAMSGLRSSLFGMTDYHRNKVGTVTVERNGRRVRVPKSSFPPDAVWESTHQESILQNINSLQHSKFYSLLPLTEKLQSSLSIVSKHWENRDEFDRNHRHWEEWKQASEEEGRYPAGGWAASPEQLSQLISVFSVMEHEGRFHRLLRLGTASGVHTQEELLAVDLARQRMTADSFEFDVVDIYKAPLRDTSHLMQSTSVKTRRASALKLPQHQFPWNRIAFPPSSVDVVTTSFIESFIPTSDEFRAKHMTHQQALVLKENMFAETRRVLKNGGVFCMTLGTEEGKGESDKDPRRFADAQEVRRSLIQAGFVENNIIITLTTDPLDFENGRHTKGNFFVIAVK